MTNGLAGWSETWKENDCKTGGDKEIWGRYIWMDLSQLVKTVKIFVSHVNVHHRVTSAEKDFDKQEDRMPCSAATGQPLSQVIPSSPNGLMNKVATVAGMEIIHGPTTQTSTQQGPSVYDHC